MTGSHKVVGSIPISSTTNLEGLAIGLAPFWLQLSVASPLDSESTNPQTRKKLARVFGGRGAIGSQADGRVVGETFPSLIGSNDRVSAKWQETRCPFPRSRHGGASFLQISFAYRHRG